MIFRFMTDLRCYLEDGSIQDVLDLPVEVEAASEDVARGYLRAVATETVHDLGSKLTDAPLKFLLITRSRREHAHE